jgi:N-acyl-D-aspartate/D-glutamate deacylase
MQDSEGYVATIVSGVVVRENGVATADLPGRLVRGMQQPDQMKLAAE